MSLLSISQLLADPELIGSSIIFKGWVKQIRFAKAGKLLFLHVGDGSNIKTIQVVFEITEDFNQEITFESSVQVHGELVTSPAAGQKVEIKAEKIILIGNCPVDYPFQKSRDGYTCEYLRQYLHLRPKTNSFSTVMRLRNTLSFATQKFYHKKGFQWIHTPILTTSDCEGAGETFKVSVEKEAQFFKEKQAYLTVSGQLHLEPFACSMGRVYTFGPSFRAEKSTTSRHLSEFWMLEPEMAFSTLDDVLSISESYIKTVLIKCLKYHYDDLLFLQSKSGKSLINKIEKTIKEDFAIVTYDQAIEILKKSGKEFEKPNEWGVDFGSDQERYICEEVFNKPTYITHYPAQIKAFYMYVDNPEIEDEQNQTVACADLLFPGIGEVMGGSQREHRYEILKTKMDKLKLNYQWYLDTRKYGSVPHAGFGIGFDRLLRYITGVDHICDVVPYPVRFESISS